MAKLKSSEEYENESFEKVTLEEKTIKYAEFRGCRFVNCSFKETMFRGCQFHDCVFTGCDLSLIKVDHSEFVRTRFVKSHVIGINWAKMAKKKSLLKQSALAFEECSLNYSTFTSLELTKIEVLQCVAKEVDFSGANLTKAVCHGTDFSGSRFVETNLTEADFTRASNYSIDVSINTVTNARFAVPEAIALLHYLGIIIEE